MFHTPPIAVGGHGSLLNKQLCFGSQSRLVLRTFRSKDRPQEAVLLHFYIASISLILRAIPCCIRLSPTPMQQIFLFQSFLIMFKALQPKFFLSFNSFSNVHGFPAKIFLLSQFFQKVQGFCHFYFKQLFQSFATLASTIKYLTRFDRKGEGHARVSHPIPLLYFAL